MKNDLIVVESIACKFTANFDGAKEYLEKELSKYDVVVTEDTLPDCKKLSTELNKMATEIGERRKKEIDLVSAPIKEFDTQMKSLVKMCKDGREKLLTQIKSFEDETKVTILALLEELRTELYEDYDLQDEFKVVQVDDLVILSNYTKAGNLSGKASSAVDSRMKECKANQDKVEMRLLKLENESFKAGLTSPLSRVHVEAFIHADDEAYQSNLVNLLEAEVKRQNESEEKIRDQVKKEQPVQQEGQQEGQQAVQTVTTVPAAEVEKPKPIEKSEAEAGKTVHVIQAMFEVQAPEGIKPEQIIKKLQKVMLGAGITSLKSIEVVA